MPQSTVHPCMELFEREIERFRRFARQRSTSHPPTWRRKSRRYHRSWPLLIATCERSCVQEYSAALHDASDDGIGFMTDHMFEAGEVVYLQLFWHEAGALRIPAVVRHVNPTPQGILVGCEYALANVDACEAALQMEQCCG